MSVVYTNSYGYQLPAIISRVLVKETCELIVFDTPHNFRLEADFNESQQPYSWRFV